MSNMADLEKFTDDAIVMLLKHDERELKNDSNTDIVPTKSDLNYSIPCNTQGLSDRAYYKQLVDDSYLYGRGTSRGAEAVTCCSWVVTLPREVSDYRNVGKDEIIRLNPESEKAFFEGVHSFIEERYGTCFHCKIHYDEGGQPHGHYFVVPRTTLDHDKVHYKTTKSHTAIKTESGRYEFQHDFKTDENGQRIPLNNYARMSDYYDYKISGADVFNKAELQHFHGDMKAYLQAHNVPGADFVYTGKTGGKNMTVASMKEFTKATGLTIDEVKELQLSKEQIQELIQTKDTTIIHLQDEVHQKDSKISDLWAELTSKEHEITELKEHRSERDIEKQSLREQLEEKKQENEKLRSAANHIINEKNQQIQTLTEDVSAKDQQLTELTEHNRQLTSDYEKAQERIRELEASLEKQKETTHEPPHAEPTREWGKTEGWGRESRTWGNKEHTYEVEE